MAEITKVGLAVMDRERVLLVRKKASGFYILPGGKPEGDEDDLAVLVREIDEELGCKIDEGSVRFLSSFSDEAAGHAGVRVCVRLYAGMLVGRPTPRSEIDELVWVPTGQDCGINLAPSLRNSILPYLASLEMVQPRTRARSGCPTACGSALGNP